MIFITYIKNFYQTLARSHTRVLEIDEENQSLGEAAILAQIR